MTKEAIQLAEYERISREREFTPWEQGFVKYLAWRVRHQERRKQRLRADAAYRWKEMERRRIRREARQG